VEIQTDEELVEINTLHFIEKSFLSLTSIKALDEMIEHLNEKNLFLSSQVESQAELDRER
jgi:hypothetical protein